MPAPLEHLDRQGSRGHKGSQDPPVPRAPRVSLVNREHRDLRVQSDSPDLPVSLVLVVPRDKQEPRVL